MYWCRNMCTFCIWEDGMGVVVVKVKRGRREGSS